MIFVSGVPVYYLFVKWDVLPDKMKKNLASTTRVLQSIMYVVSPETDQTLHS